MKQASEIIQSPLFARQKKKLRKKQVQCLDKAVLEILAEPGIGEAKVGDLKGVQVYKFKMGNDQILLAYEQIAESLYLYNFGVHQNFYKTLKKYRGA